MRRTITGLVAALALVATSATTAHAQSATANATATIDIPTVLFIDVSDTQIDFGSPGQSDFEAGFISTTEQSVITTKGNVAHDLTIAADNATFSGGSGNKSSTDLLWSASGDITAPGDGNGLSTSATAIQSGLAQGAHPDVATVDYGMLLDYATDSPAQYTLNFTYTVVPN